MEVTTETNGSIITGFPVQRPVTVSENANSSIKWPGLHSEVTEIMLELH